MRQGSRTRFLAGFVALFGHQAFAGAEPVIVVDPGHGGFQEGALSAEGLAEKALSLELARLVREALQKEVGAKVWLTREADTLVPLTERVVYVNRKRPDLFISIHANSMPTRRLRRRVAGIETFFLSAEASGEDASRTADRENAEASTPLPPKSRDALSYILADLARREAHADSSRLAYAVHQKLIANTRATDRGVQQAPFQVLTGVQAPAILIEVGFISHPEEGRRLGDPKYQQLLAQAITSGVKTFLEKRIQVSGRANPMGAAYH
jgi:N-acetylmuramoyl-L-alanine amidase